MAEKKRPAEQGRADQDKRISSPAYPHIRQAIKHEMLSLPLRGNDTLADVVEQFTRDSYKRRIAPTWVVYRIIEDLIDEGKLELAPGLLVRRKRGAV